MIEHSRAGPLLATAGTMLGQGVRVRLRRRQAAGAGALVEPTVTPDLAARLREMADPRGRLPSGPQWRGEEELAAVVPDPAVRQHFAARCPRLPLAMLEEIQPPAPGWPSARCGYLQLSEAYHGEAARSRELGWLIRRQLSGHLALLTVPALVAREVRTLIGRP